MLASWSRKRGRRIWNRVGLKPFSTFLHPTKKREQRKRILQTIMLTSTPNFEQVTVSYRSRRVWSTMYLYRPVIGAAHQSVFLATKGLDGVSARENLIVSQHIDWWNIQQKYRLSLLEFKEASRVTHAAGFANDKSIITSTIISGSGSFLCAKTVTLFHLQTASKTIVWTTVQQKISAKI